MSQQGCLNQGLEMTTRNVYLAFIGIMEIVRMEKVADILILKFLPVITKMSVERANVVYIITTCP